MNPFTTSERVSHAIAATPKLDAAGTLLIASEVLDALRAKAAHRVPELERAYQLVGRGIERRFAALERRAAP
ncbi:MAG: hypothetical protein HY560_01295 [Gemmatimonadetes bacterium]|nr:hypothetical protein [Gemmatimonadota bacterium]